MIDQGKFLFMCLKLLLAFFAMEKPLVKRGPKHQN